MLIHMLLGVSVLASAACVTTSLMLAPRRGLAANVAGTLVACGQTMSERLISRAFAASAFILMAVCVAVKALL